MDENGIPKNPEKQPTAAVSPKKATSNTTKKKVSKKPAKADAKSKADKPSVETEQHTSKPKVGDKVKVKVVGFDNRGKIKLSMKEIKQGGEKSFNRA